MNFKEDLAQLKTELLNYREVGGNIENQTEKRTIAVMIYQICITCQTSAMYFPFPI